MGKNYFSVSGSFGDGPKTISVNFSDYIEESVQEAETHNFQAYHAFPDLNEFSKLDSTSSLGLGKDILNFSREALATIKMVEAGGSFKNVLGYYSVFSDGTIRDVSIAFSNTRSAESGLTHHFETSANGTSLNFFVIGNGYSLNRVFSRTDFDEGDLSFVYHYGQDDERPATIHDKADDISLIYTDGEGKDVEVKGPVYHATESGTEGNINAGGNVHVVSGLVEDGENDVLRIGFEDFPGLGDADFNDIVFDVSASYLNNPSAGFLAGIEPAASSGEEQLAEKEEESDKQFGSDRGSQNEGIGGPDGGMSDGEENPSTGEENSPGNGDGTIAIADVITYGDQTDESIAGFIALNNDGNSDTHHQPDTSPHIQPVERVIDIMPPENTDLPVDLSTVV